jgi:DNA repair ATPase RecN
LPENGRELEKLASKRGDQDPVEQAEVELKVVSQNVAILVSAPRERICKHLSAQVERQKSKVQLCRNGLDCVKNTERENANKTPSNIVVELTPPRRSFKD